MAVDASLLLPCDDAGAALMRKIIYSVAMSLDGYVAGPNGEADWIVMDPDIDFMTMMARFDTVLMGRKTFEAAQKMGGGGAIPGVTSIVVSRTLRPENHPEVTILCENLADEVARLRDKPGKDIWLFGGGSLFRSLLDLGLVDSVEVAIIPVLLGGGVPFLPERSSRSKLKLEKSRLYAKTGIMSLERFAMGLHTVVTCSTGILPVRSSLAPASESTFTGKTPVLRRVPLDR